MSQEIIKVLEYLGEKLGIAIDWTTENVLPYAENLFKRYVALKITYTSIGTVVGLVLAVVAIVLCVKLVKTYNSMKTTETSNIFWYIEKRCYSYDWDTTACGAIAMIVAGLFTLISIPMFIFSVIDLIKWIIIPEVPFIKEITNFISTM